MNEIRTYSNKLDTRAVKREGYLPFGLQGYAAVYGSESRDMGGWKEVLVRGAFTKSLAKKLDVRLLAQHDTALVLARESAGNLTLREDAEGLWFEADLVDTSLNRDVLASVRAKNLDAMSFGMPMSSVQTKWERSKGGEAIRNVLSADVVEISVVTWPAYEATTVSARGMDKALREFQDFMQHDAAGKSEHLERLRARVNRFHR